VQASCIAMLKTCSGGAFISSLANGSVFIKSLAFMVASPVSTGSATSMARRAISSGWGLLSTDRQPSAFQRAIVEK